MRSTGCAYTRTDPTVHDLPADTFDRLAGELPATQLVHLIAVAAGAKPGFVHPSFTDTTLDVLTTLLDDAELPYRLYEKPTSTWLAVASTTAAYHEMPPYDTVDNLCAFEGAAARQNGRFLGVPEPDNCWRPDDLNADVTPPYQPMLTECAVTTPSNWVYLPLVSYLCRPTDAGIQRAADVGAQYYQACERAREVFGTPQPVQAATAVIEGHTADGCFYVDFHEQTPTVATA